MADVFNFYVRDNRKITFEIAEPIMREDSGVTDFVFHIPKSINNLDMSDWQWWFVFVNANKEKYSIALTLSDDPERPLEFNTATYTVDYAMSIKAGSVQFALEAINAGTGGAIDNEWHTLTYETKVKETLQGNQAEYAETESDIISALLEEVRTKMNQVIGGATPAPVKYKAQMTDPQKVYLYIGSEPNEHAEHWYYHNGTTFVSGGVYGAGVTDSVPTQGSTNAVQSGGVYDKISSTSFFEQKMSVAMAEIIPNVVPILEMGDMTINSSGWTYNDGTTKAKRRVRTAKGYSIPLKRGDKVGLTDYTDAKYYLGWRLPDESYGSHGWYTADTTIAYDGDYVILLAHATEVDLTGVEDLGNLLFVKKFGGHYNPVAVSQRSSGKDILKTTTWEEGYIDAGGSVHAPTAQQEIASDFIAIDVSTIYRMRLKHSRYTESAENSPWLSIASYDSDRHFVRRPAVSTAVYKDDDSEYLEMLFTPESGEASIRVSFRSFGDYSAELIALTDGISWYGYPIREPKDLQGGHNLFLKGVNHRGWGECPENTLEAYIQSAVHGFNFVETDVRYTSDGVPVLLHDASINRTARNADGTTISTTVNIVDITYAQSQEYDFGIYKGSAFAGTKIPRFEDFIVLCKRLGLHPYIELKTGMSNAQIINLVDIVLNYGMENDVTWIAYPTGWFTLISNKHKKSRFGVLMTSTSQTNIDSALSYRTGENSVFINTSDYGSDAVALAKTNGIPMEVWTLDEDEDIKSLDPYITGVTSNLKIAGAVVYSNLTT